MIMHWLLTQRAHAPVKVSLFSIAFGREIESAARSRFQKCHRTCAPCIASCAAPCRDRSSPVAHAKRARGIPPSPSCCSRFAPAATYGCCPACCVTNLHARTQQPPSRPAKNQVSTLTSLVGQSSSRLRLLECRPRPSATNCAATTINDAKSSWKRPAQLPMKAAVASAAASRFSFRPIGARIGSSCMAGGQLTNHEIEKPVKMMHPKKTGYLTGCPPLTSARQLSRCRITSARVKSREAGPR